MNKKKIALIIVFFAVFIFGVVVGFCIAKEKLLGKQLVAAPENQEIAVNLMLDFGNGNIKTCQNAKLYKDKTVFGLLKYCSKNSSDPFDLDYGNSPKFGIFIKSIGGKKNGEGNKYWQYWVDNVYASVGRRDILSNSINLY